ncbi:flagellar basal body-associated protein FliL [Acidisphaera rubrifaciens HS-AP3]|uniref:Flagellar protein FliL n=2 Tax=Acidisphaera TaxID=50714 RepID=A0A0D6P7Q3_9PROT|nr:flagellar basal body-associated protein FliL [Acidisphaera rubrifaciens HS-AP3]
MLAVPVLLGVIGAGLWFTGILPRLLGHGTATQVHAVAAAPPVYIDVPEMVANLNGNPRRPSYVKLRAKLEVAGSADTGPVQAAMPRLIDLFQTHLRDMRPEEFRGSAGTYRLREELIARATLVAAPAHIQDVLFEELLVQ